MCVCVSLRMKYGHTVQHTAHNSSDNDGAKNSTCTIGSAPQVGTWWGEGGYNHQRSTEQTSHGAAPKGRKRVRLFDD